MEQNAPFLNFSTIEDDGHRSRWLMAIVVVRRTLGPALMGFGENNLKGRSVLFKLRRNEIFLKKLGYIGCKKRYRFRLHLNSPKRRHFGTNSNRRDSSTRDLHVFDQGVIPGPFAFSLVQISSFNPFLNLLQSSLMSWFFLQFGPLTSNP